MLEPSRKYAAKMPQTSTPKTIQIFLPNGDPQGIRVAEITTRIVQVLEVPRSLLNDFYQMPEAGQVALYFLVGATDDGDEAVYVGQTGDLISRLRAHNREKDFWEKALIVISRTNSLTQTHGVFLEWYCIKTSREVNRYPDMNGNAGSEPFTPPPLQADCLEIFETAEILLATLGYPIFEKVARPSESGNGSQHDQRFYCRRPGVEAQGLYTSEGFVVLQGAIGCRDVAAYMEETSLDRRRQELIRNGIFLDDGSQLVLQKDYLFNSPSMASAVLAGKSSNGWVAWKSKDNRTLDEVIRKAD